LLTGFDLAHGLLRHEAEDVRPGAGDSATAMMIEARD
jgi:hypothetical protein